MRIRVLTLILLISVGAFLMHAQTPPAPALAGQVTSVEEGAMEGVLVSAKKDGSTITTTVVTDQQGRYYFPAAKLPSGHYSLKIRAVGYDLDSQATVDVAAGGATTLDLKLVKARDLASQLSNTEWLQSF